MWPVIAEKSGFRKFESADRSLLTGRVLCYHAASMAKLAVAVDDGDSEMQVIIERGNSIAMCKPRFVI